jgi:hypothetical protein
LGGSIGAAFGLAVGVGVGVGAAAAGGSLPPLLPTPPPGSHGDNNITTFNAPTPLFDHETWLLAADDEQFKKLVDTIEQTLLHTIVLLAEHGYEATQNPLPTAGIIVAGAVCSPYVLGSILVADLIANHRELLLKSKKFGRLLFQNTPEAMAELGAFCVETAFLHRASTAAAKRYVRDIMPRIKKLFNEIANRARTEEALALATQGFGGEKVQLKHAEFFDGAGNAIKKAVEEEISAETGILKFF